MKNIPITKFKYEDLKKIWSEEFMKLLNFINDDLKIINDRNEVYNILNKIYSSVKARNLYNFYMNIIFDGLQNTKNKVSKSVYYRNIKVLRNLNINLSQRIDIDMVDNRIEFNPFEYKEVV